MRKLSSWLIHPFTHGQGNWSLGVLLEGKFSELEDVKLVHRGRPSNLPEAAAD